MISFTTRLPRQSRDATSAFDEGRTCPPATAWSRAAGEADQIRFEPPSRDARAAGTNHKNPSSHDLPGSETSTWPQRRHVNSQCSKPWPSSIRLVVIMFMRQTGHGGREGQSVIVASCADKPIRTSHSGETKRQTITMFPYPTGKQAQDGIKQPPGAACRGAVDPRNDPICPFCAQPTAV